MPLRTGVGSRTTAWSGPTLPETLSSRLVRQSTYKTIASIAILGAILLVLQFLPFKEWLQPFWDFVRGSGPWGYAIFLVAGVVLSLLLLPISPIIIAGGVLFGFWQGLAMAGAVLILSTSAGYLAGEAFWMRIKDHRSFQNRWFRAVRTALEKEGVYLVALLRMTPFIHFTVGNLFYGSLSLKFWRYLVASMIGMVPGTMVLVYAGYLAQQSLSQEVDLSGWHVGLFIVGVLIFAGISVLVTHRTRQILDQES